MNKEIFALMAHAEDLQKIADQSQRRLETAVNTLPENAQKAITEVFLAETAEPLQKAKEELKTAVNGLKGSMRSVWLVPVVVCLVFTLGMIGFVYFGVSWLKSERAELQREIAGLKSEYNEMHMELAKTANVVRYENGELWVEIANVKDVGTTKDGKHWARMPRR